jgi:hypothetical protein
MTEAQNTPIDARPQRAKRGEGWIVVSCPYCQQQRATRAYDWNKRQSDLCRPCLNRSKVGLDADAGAESGKGTRLYNIWRNMRQRCGLFGGVKPQDREAYLDRGITVCAQWATAFRPFKEWAEANGYGPDRVIDRRDNDAGYSPENCWWTDVQTNNRNRRCVKLNVQDVAVIKSELARGVKGRALAAAYGMSEAAISNIKSGKKWGDVVAAS